MTVQRRQVGVGAFDVGEHFVGGVAGVVGADCPHGQGGEEVVDRRLVAHPLAPRSVWKPAEYADVRGSGADEAAVVRVAVAQQQQRVSGVVLMRQGDALQVAEFLSHDALLALVAGEERRLAGRRPVA